MQSILLALSLLASTALTHPDLQPRQSADPAYLAPSLPLLETTPLTTAQWLRIRPILLGRRATDIPLHPIHARRALWRRRAERRLRGLRDRRHQQHRGVGPDGRDAAVLPVRAANRLLVEPQLAGSGPQRPAQRGEHGHLGRGARHNGDGFDGRDVHEHDPSADGVGVGLGFGGGVGGGAGADAVEFVGLDLRYFDDGGDYDDWVERQRNDDGGGGGAHDDEFRRLDGHEYSEFFAFFDSSCMSFSTFNRPSYVHSIACRRSIRYTTSLENKS